MKKEICFAAVLLLFLSTSMTHAESPSAGTNLTASSITSSNGAVTSGSAVTSNSAIAIKLAIKLSLKDAIKIMQTTGTRAETAELNKKSDQAIATGYGEKVQTINETLNKLKQIDMYMPSISASASLEAQEAGATTTNKEIMKLRRDFAKEQIDANYKAEMNQIEYDTIKVYYGVLLAQDNLRTEQDNLKTREDILKNTKLQYKVGMFAKKDVLSAESSVTSAKSGVRAAETKLEYAKMSFNYLLGYAVMQEVVFTDTLDAVTASDVKLEESIGSAVKNRNEIKGANFAVGVYKILFNDVKAYPKSSSTYLNKQIALLSAEDTAKNAPIQIEIDIRNKAAELEDKKAALEAARSMQDYAQEGYRLIRISYDAGMSTLTELQQAQGNVYKAGLAVSSAISDYDLAAYAFRYAEDVGVQRLPL